MTTPPRNSMLDRGYQQQQMMQNRLSLFGPPLHHSSGASVSHIEPLYDSTSTARMVRGDAWEQSPQRNVKVNSTKVNAAKEQSR
jgi:hypothetical protein